MHETRICLVFVADPVSWFFLTEIYFIQLKIKEVLIINKAECRSSEYVALQICYLVLWHHWEKIKKIKDMLFVFYKLLASILNTMFTGLCFLLEGTLWLKLQLSDGYKRPQVFFYQIKLILGLLKLDQKQFLVTLTFVSGWGLSPQSP